MSQRHVEPGYRDILTSLLSTRDVQRAIRDTIARGSNAYSFWHYVRNKIIHNTENRHPQYLSRLRDLQYRHFSPQDKEWDLLEHLYNSPLGYQYRVESSPKPYLADHPELDKALKMIQALPNEFYAYELPEEYGDAHRERKLERREAKHMNPVNIANLQTILCLSREWRDFKHPWEIVACALILCGRRVGEVLSSLVWEKHGPYTALVGGIAKRDMLDEDRVVIPLLCVYEDFDEIMTKIREAQLPTTSTTHRLKPACVKVFGQWFNHSQRRNIYGEAAYRMRHESGFHPDMSKIMWIDKALSHAVNVVAVAGNLTYQSLTFNNE